MSTNLLEHPINKNGARCSFSALNIGEVFEHGGRNSSGGLVQWFKCSERTARLVENNRVFYFKSGEVVTACGKLK